MCVIKIHAFIYFLRPPPWYGTIPLWHLNLLLCSNPFTMPHRFFVHSEPVWLNCHAWHNVQTIYLECDFLSTVTICPSMEKICYLIINLDRNNLFLCDISPLCDIVIMYFYPCKQMFGHLRDCLRIFYYYFFASQTEQNPLTHGSVRCVP